MSDDISRILQMVAEGKISVSEGSELISALNSSDSKANSSSEDVVIGNVKTLPKFLKVHVDSADGDNVDVKVPLALLRSGIKFSSVIPRHLSSEVHSQFSEKGLNLDLNNINPEDIDGLIQALTEMEVNVDSANGDKVRVFCE